MPTISAQVDKHLKDGLTSKARKEGKSVSNLVKEALKEIDLDKEEFKEEDSESKTKEGKEAAPQILKELNNLSSRIGEIEYALAEIGKAEACLGEIITQRVVDYEKKWLDEIQHEDAHRTHLHNQIIGALEKIANKNLEECKGHHPRWSE